MKISFYGAAQTVTGSKHLLTLDSGKKILLDCGLFQGMGDETRQLNTTFGFDAATIDALILSHAHIDHSGNIPNLVKQGFRGKIYATDATIDLCNIMLADSAHIHEQDVRFVNKRRSKHGRPLLKPLYTIDDVKVSMKLFQKVDLNKWIKPMSGFEFMFTDAGHILGSAAVNMRIQSGKKTISVFFSGDIGRREDVILKKPQPFPQADYVICESTYGDRLHEDTSTAENTLRDIISDTCIKRKGKVIIPAFSLGRTQELVYAIDRLITQKKLPMIKVYVDSPLASNATDIMRRHPEYFNNEILQYMKTDPDPFGFEKLKYVREVEESKALNDSNEPCIIISASGMTDAGRIKHHIKNNVSNKKNTILIVGYLPPDSLGGKLLAGNAEVKIFGEQCKVKAKICCMDSYSAHGDYQEMLEYLSCLDKSKVKAVFLVHGEKEVQLKWKKTLETNGFNNVVVPAKGESFEF